MADNASTPTAGVENTNETLADEAGIPDGPNVGPSPQEHLAARGHPGSVAGVRPDASDTAGGSAEDPAAAVTPEEQELVDEQGQRDREASRKVDPSAQ